MAQDPTKHSEMLKQCSARLRVKPALGSHQKSGYSDLAHPFGVEGDFACGELSVREESGPAHDTN